MSLPLLAVDQVFTVVTGSPSEQDLQDYVLGMVFANAAARAARNSTVDPAAKVNTFTAQWRNQLGSLGWVITAAGSSSLESTGSRQITTVADKVRAQAPAAIDTALDALAAIAKSGSGAAQALAEMVWSEGSAEAPFSVAVGQFSSEPNGPFLELAVITLSLDALAVKERGLVLSHDVKLEPTSVEGLFAEVLASSITLNVSSFSAKLQQEVFATKRAEIVEKLRGRAGEHFLSLPSGLVKGVA